MPLNATTFDVQSLSPGMKYIEGVLEGQGVGNAPTTPLRGVNITRQGVGEYTIDLPGVGDLDLREAFFNVTTANPFPEFQNSLDMQVTGTSGTSVSVRNAFWTGGLDNQNVIEPVSTADVTDLTEHSLMRTPGNMFLLSAAFVPDAAASGAGSAAVTMRTYPGGTTIATGTWTSASLVAFTPTFLTVSAPQIAIGQGLTVEINKTGGLTTPTGAWTFSYVGYQAADLTTNETVYFKFGIKNSSARG